MTPSKTPGEPGTGRRGRRPAGEDTRAAIMDAARAEFSAKGYDASSLRAIARLAEVDPAFVHHYFDGKSHLFAETMSLPARPDELIGVVLDGPREQRPRPVSRFPSSTTRAKPPAMMETC